MSEGRAYRQQQWEVAASSISVCPTGGCVDFSVPAGTVAAMRRILLLSLLSVAILATACDTRPSPPNFAETTTTSTTLPGIDDVSTTTVTLPPVDRRVEAQVVSVTDGDTFDASIGGVPETVRLLGINSPEADECWGPEATVALSDLISGETVLLDVGEEDRDSFGRLLRYVYVESGDEALFVNSRLVEDGNAVAIQNGSEESEIMKLYEARAFQSGHGMWATYACGDSEGVAADRPVIRVEELRFDPPGPDGDALGDEYITIVNEGYGTVPIGGWTIRDESSSNRYTFDSGTTLAPGEAITVATGCSDGPSGAVHWCNDQAVWSNDGDTAYVLDTLGNVVVWYTY